MKNPMLDDIQETYERGDKALVAYTNGGSEIRALSRLSQTSDTVPKLVAALLAVEAMHTQELGGTPTGEFAYICGGCPNYWPCPTIGAIREALNG